MTKTKKDRETFATIEELLASKNVGSEFAALSKAYETKSYDKVVSELISLFHKNLLPSSKVSELQEYLGKYYTGFVRDL